MKILLRSSLLIAALCTPVAASAQEADAPPRQIIVSGAGEVSVSPDFAAIRAGVRETAPTAQAAMQAAAEKMMAVFDGLTEMGVADEDIQTSQLSLGAIYSEPQDYSQSQERKLEGYEAHNTLSIRLHDTERIGEILDALTQLGLNDIQNIYFDVVDRSPLENDAMRNAVADAKLKADILAEAAGVRLGAVERISFGPTRRPIDAPVIEMARDFSDRSGGATTPIAAGELTVSRSVQIIYAIE